MGSLAQLRRLRLVPGRRARSAGSSVPAGASLKVELRKRYAAGGQSCFQLAADFEVKPGFTILLGHSGAGKTTLLRCIAGLSDPEQGRITIGERTLFDSQARVNVEAARRRIAFVFQDLALFPHLTAEENIAYGLSTLDPEERKRRTSRILELFQIAHLRKRLPRAISGGEQQRVALARSLVTEPDVLLLDEPLSSLDPRTKASLIDDLRRWNEERRIPILYVTHDNEEVFALGERVLILDRGQIVAEGSPREVVPMPSRAALAPVAAFENVLDTTVVALHEREGSMTCRVAGSSVEVSAPFMQVGVGSEVRLGIHAGEILLAFARPEMAGCNVVHGRVTRIDREAGRVEVRSDSGAEFRVDAPPAVVECCETSASGEVWMVFRTASCHMLRAHHRAPSQRLFVFVCSGNTSRSPIAQAICNAELSKRLGMPLAALGQAGVRAISAGLTARPGAPMTLEAQEALRALGLPPLEHRSQTLTAELVASADTIFCMTARQRQTALEMFPDAARKISCLDALGDLDDPSGEGPEAFLALARRVEGLIHERLGEMGLPA